MGNPIRVLHVFGIMNRGGAETMVMNIYRNIDRSLIQFDFAVHSDNTGDYDEEIRRLGGNIFILPSYKLLNHSFYKRSWIDYYQNKNKALFIHGHIRSTGVIYLRLARIFKLKTIIHSHSISNGSGIAALIKNIMQYKVGKYADYCFACSAPAGKWLFGKDKLPGRDFIIVKNAVDLHRFAYDRLLRSERRDALGITDQLVIGHIGRYVRVKNHMFLLEILNEIVKVREDVVLILAGRGKLERKIRNKVADLGLGNKVIFSDVTDDVPALMQIMDVFVLPSLYEGIPVTLIEAQANSLPCLVADKVSVEADCGLVSFLSLSDVGKWTSALLSSKRRCDVTKDGYKRVRKAGYDINSVSEWLQKFYIDNGEKDE